ncbi:MAG: ParA family partition ATPase [Pseudomonadota bacterium]|nr:ParA family partition ATPase [Pseudomonadota bacterium]
MAGKVIAIAQQKGGAGKTTLVAQLAVCFAGLGHSVAVVDIDPQQSLSTWHAVRHEHLGGDGGITLRQVSGWRTGSEVERLRRDFGIVLVDSPPHGDTDAKIAVRSADRVLMPVQPGPMDYWAAKQSVALAEREKKDFLIVLNRVPARSRVADQIRGMIEQDGLAVAETTLGNRQAFAASLMLGLGVTEDQPKGTAAAEIRALAGEILKG